jgi:peptidoglycan hydrolase-like protein with peptidoglycan-binding domain
MHIKTKIVGALMLAVLVVPGISLAQTQSVADLQALIASLMAQVQQLQAQLTAQTGGSTATSWCYDFNTNLSVGMSGSAVTALQTALQKDGESVTVNGSFDDQTASAVTGFQEKYASSVLTPSGLSNGTGYAGKATRTKLNSFYGCGTTASTVVGGGTATSTTGTANAATATYQNSTYGIKFSYPSSYTVKYGNDAFGTSNNPLGDSGIGMENSNLTSLVTIEMPSNSYPDTGFDGAYLNVSVGTQMTYSQCSAMNAAGSSPSSGIKTIGGVPFNWTVDGSAAAGTDFTNGSFSGYTNGTCYVLLAGGVEGNGAIGNLASDGAIITAVNQNSVLAALNSVLATMTFSAPINLPIACPAWGCGNPPITIVTSTISTVLSVAQNPSFPSGSTIAGSQSQKIASYTIAAPLSESVTLSQVGLTFQGSSATYVNGVLVAYNPALAASTSGHNGTYGLTNTGGQSSQTNLPSQLNVIIAAGSSITLDFYAVNVNNVPAGSQIATSLTCAAQGNISNVVYSCGANQGQAITIATVSNPTASNLQMKADVSFPGGHVAAAGTVYLGTFDLTTTGGESVKILSLPTNYFIQGSNVTGGEITNLELVNGNGQQIGSTISSLTSANTNGAAGNGIYDATFGSQNNPLNLIVPGNSTMKISILGNLSASAGGDSIQAGISGGSLGNAVGATYNLNVLMGDVGAPTIYPTSAQ